MKDVMDQTTYHSGHIENRYRLKLFWQAWCAHEARASIVIVHGVGEHSGRYEEFARYCARNGFSVYTFDLMGYGRSEGKRGHINAFTDFTADVKLFIEYVRSTINVTHKLFLLGHSLGALISVRTLGIYDDLPLDGLIISGPPFRLNLTVASWRGRICSFLGSIIPALMVKETSIRLNMLTHDQKKLDEFAKDPYRHYHRSIRFIQEYFRAEKAAFKDSEKIKVPFLLLQGSDDDIVDVKKVKEFYHALRMEDKTLVIYPTMYHEVLNEVDREKVYDDIVSWISRRIIPKKA